MPYVRRSAREGMLLMYWMDAWTLGTRMWTNGVALQETLMASQEVVERRNDIIGAALRNPLDADVGELHRMGSEKVEAFGKASASWTRDWFDIQAGMMAQGSDVAALMLGGWPPSSASIERIGKRGTKLANRMSKAGGRALAPVHATATANQRRLKKSSA